MVTWCSMTHRCQSVIAVHCLYHHCHLFKQNIDNLLLNYMIAGLHSHGLLCSVRCYMFTKVFRQPIGPIVKDQEVQEECQ
jgi:hypothetical protein